MLCLAGIQTEEIDPRALEASVADPSCGAILTFLGVVRDVFDGRSVSHLEYEAYAEMAEKVIADVVAEIDTEWPGARIAVVHRTGRLSLEEISIGIAVATPHRDHAYAVSRACIDRLKARLPVWKKEHFTEGAPEWRANPEFAGEVPKAEDEA